MSIYKKLAEALGAVGGVPITEQDVREEMATKSYNRNIGSDGLLPRMEMERLKKYVKHAVAQRLVDEEFAKRTKATTKTVVKSTPQLSAWQRKQRQDALIDRALATRRVSTPMAKAISNLLDPTHQAQVKALAWEEYRRGFSC